MKKINPISRLIFFLLGIMGAIISMDLIVMTLFWLILVCLFLFTKKIKYHLKFLIYIILPIFIILSFVWGTLIGKSPTAFSYNFFNGYLYALFISIRLVLLGSIFQLTFITIPPNDFIYVLTKWKLKGNNLIIILGTLTVFPDLIKKSDKLLTARYARGVVKNRNLINRFRQLPYILKPLIINSFYSAIERTESWNNKKILRRVKIDDFPKTIFLKTDFVIIFLTTLWFISNIVIFAVYNLGIVNGIE